MRKALLDAARECARVRGIPLRAISRLAYGNSTFFENLSRGRNVSFTVNKFDTVMCWFHDHRNWPGGDIPGAVVDLFASLEKEAAS